MSVSDNLELSLVSRQTLPLRALPGFRKDHYVPTQPGSSASAFVARLGAGRIRADLDETFRRLRSAFAFRRTELTSFEGEGDGSLTTPLFQYECSLSLYEQDPEHVVWQRKVGQFQDANEILTVAFEQAFPDTFDTVVFVAPEEIDIAALIDHLELKTDTALSIQYDREATYCDITLTGLHAQLHIAPQRAEVHLPHVTSPQTLMEAFLEMQSSVMEFATLPRISNPSDTSP